MENKINSIQAFSKVSTYLDLQKYLQDKATGLKNTENGAQRYLCHYTSLKAAVGIIKSGKWYIGSPIEMNDGLELSHADRDVWEKIFFASFMLEPKESIAMWSMYAQPWPDGVMIRIPVEVFKEWMKSSPQMSSADSSTKQANPDNITDLAHLRFHAVAYTNAESKNKGEIEELICGGQINNTLHNSIQSKELVGYIKDCAWSYENEYRMRIDMNSFSAYRGIALSVPEKVINAMEITAGPRFEDDLYFRIEEEVAIAVSSDRLKNSIFRNKLNWVYCDSCLRLNSKSKALV